MGVGIGKMITTVVVIAELIGGQAPVVNVPDPAPVETQAVIETQAIREIPQSPRAEGVVAYRIYGRDLPMEWQTFLYGKLAARGYGWYYPYAVCQIFQESRWSQWSDNGRDFGICQQKGIYWESRAAHYGIAGADIWDVYAQFHVYAAMMCDYLDYYGGDVGMALSAYYLGAWEYSETYVNNVMEHWPALEVVR